MGIVSLIRRRNTRRHVRVEQIALHLLLTEVHDLRARQGVDGCWLAGMPPALARQASLALELADADTAA